MRGINPAIFRSPILDFPPKTRPTSATNLFRSFSTFLGKFPRLPCIFLLSEEHPRFIRLSIRVYESDRVLNFASRNFPTSQIPLDRSMDLLRTNSHRRISSTNSLRFFSRRFDIFRVIRNKEGRFFDDTLFHPLEGGAERRRKALRGDCSSRKLGYH